MKYTKDICIYRHLKPNGEVFYIGIGQLHRPYTKSDRNNFWKKVVSKYGYEVQILKTNLSWEEAKELENILINYYGRRDLEQGTLVNLTDGGEGVSGYKRTKEWKSETSYRMRGNKNPMFGVSPSDKCLDVIKKPVKQYSLEGDFIKLWNSAKDAANALGIHAVNISRCCKGKANKTGNFKWEYYVKEK